FGMSAVLLAKLQPDSFRRHGENFRVAREQAQKHSMTLQEVVLTKALAEHAESSRHFREAERLFKELAALLHRLNDEAGEAFAFKSLGNIATELGDWAGAENWYRRVLEIGERLHDEETIALADSQLGIIAQQRGELDDAEAFFLKSLEVQDQKTFDTA